MTKRIACVENGVVVNVVVHDDDFVPDNAKTFESATASKGWILSGGALMPPDLPPTKAILLAYAADKRRYLIATGKKLTAKGQVWIDNGTRSTVSDFIQNIDLGTIAAPVNFKMADGSFVACSRADLVAMLSAINTAQQTCFNIESGLQESITGGGVTTFAQIDAAGWPSV